MNAVAPVAAPDRNARRLEAFCSPGGDVFQSIVYHQEIWRADPFDVEMIHAEARDVFERLLHRAALQPPPLSGRILLLQGSSGSGKTHLMRAFRHCVHANGRGYFGYLQMTPLGGNNYARYLLSNLIGALEQPYSLPDVPISGLTRLSRSLLDCVPHLDNQQRTSLAEGSFTDPDLAKLIRKYADRVQERPAFRHYDLDLIRALLYLHRDEVRIHTRLLKFLRCEELSESDRAVIPDIIPRPHEEAPQLMIGELGKVMSAIDHMPLVLCVDQLEDTFNQGEEDKLFRRAIDTLVAVADSVPTAIVVVSCLEDYYTAKRQCLPRPKLDRVENDPEPHRLTAQRSLPEIEALIGRRLQCLYEEHDVPWDAAEPTFPFTQDHLERLSNLRTRDVLDFCRLHRDRCIRAGQWLEPESPTPSGSRPPHPKPEPRPSTLELEQLWNDFHSHFLPNVPDDEKELAAILAEAIAHCSQEIAPTHWFAAEKNGRVIPVDLHHPDNAVDRFFVAICDRGTQGGGLSKQITELEKQAGDMRTVVVRSTEFPSNPKAEVTKRLGALIGKKNWRRAVVNNADWRRMLALEKFRANHAERPDFAFWLRESRPLTQMTSLQQILALDSLPSPAVTVMDFADPIYTPSVQPSSRAKDVAETENGPLTLGVTRGVAGEPVSLEPKRLVHHMAFLGGTGSGKTTAALNLIEQLLLLGVPAVLLDRKGDLCRYADPDAWTAPLASPEREARRQRLRARLDIALYTPGQPNGRPLAIPLIPEGKEQLNSLDRELLAGYAAASLGGMMNYRSAGADKQKLAILRKAVELLGELAGKEASLPNLIHYLEDGDDSLYAAVGNLGDARLFAKLARDLQTLHINQSRLLDGNAERLNLDALLGLNEFARPGRTRLSIISTRFLETSAVEFWVSQFLTAIGRWIGRQPRDQLQAVFLFDEADLYLPATRQPATKAPMENLLKRGRSAGVGVFLATQSPGDFDYKCRDNIQTWLVGRVKEETALKKLKPMFSECRVDVAAKLPGQETGQFYLLREKEAIALQSAQSLLKTEQVPEERILDLACANRIPLVS